MPRSLTAIAKETLGKNLKEVRLRRRGWTQLEAAERAGVRGDRLNRWEKGREAPGAEGLLLLAIAYDCSIDQLLSGVNEKYDEIIERRLPVDATRHYAAKNDAIMGQLAELLRQARAGEVSAPSAATKPDGRVRARGKSSRAGVRRKPGKVK